jgi:long-chain acyl-CoA synthetase
MTDLSHRRWQGLYGTMPPTIAPPSATGLQMFQSMASRQRGRPLVHYFDRSISVDEIDAMSDALAVALQQRGVEPGERIAMYLQNVPQVLITVLAAWKCGAVVVPCNPMLRERELVKILTDSGSRVLICHDDLYTEVARAALPLTAVQHTITTSPLDFLEPGTPLPPILASTTRLRYTEASDLGELVARHVGAQPQPVEITADDVAFMVYTSGTTGEPKAAMNTHGNVVFATSVYERWIDITEADTILGLAPLFHVTGLIGHVALALLTGSPLILFYRFDSGEACRLVERHRATFTVSAVTAFIALLNSDAMAGRDFASLTRVYTGGAPTPPGVLAEWHARTGTRIQPMYGLTEATSPTHMTPHGVVPPVDARTGAVSIGVPVFNTAVRVMTDAGAEAGPGEIGEFLITGPQIVPGYWQKPAETAKSLAGGELRTGDIGFMDEAGWFYLVDRAKDMIVASGFKVWPSEVEEVLYLHPAVREAAVVGMPDPYRGETIKAVISLKTGHETTPDAIKAFARERMAAYKYPRFVEIIDDLPKTASGKIMRRMLQTAIGAGVPTVHGGDVAAASYPQLRAALEARGVLEAGVVWLRLSRGSIPRSTSEALYERLRVMVGYVGADGRFLDRDALLAAHEAFHAAVIALADNEYLSQAFRRLRLREHLARALKDQTHTPENVVSAHELLTDAIAGGDAIAAVQAIMAWKETSRASVHTILGDGGEGRAAADFQPASAIEDLTVAQAQEQSGRAADVDALVQALDARAAIEIGITQTLGDALTPPAERDALVARLRAFTPLVRGAGARHVWRHIRADDAFHRVFLSLLRNPALFDVYNAMDVPELMRRVLEVAPLSIRGEFDDHKGLTDALSRADANAVSAAITEHANRVRAALARFVAAPAGGHEAGVSTSQVT